MRFVVCLVLGAFDYVAAALEAMAQPRRFAGKAGVLKREFEQEIEKRRWFPSAAAGEKR